MDDLLNLDFRNWSLHLGLLLPTCARSDRYFGGFKYRRTKGRHRVLESECAQEISWNFGLRENGGGLVEHGHQLRKILLLVKFLRVLLQGLGGCQALHQLVEVVRLLLQVVHDWHLGRQLGSDGAHVATLAQLVLGLALHFSLAPGCPPLRGFNQIFRACLLSFEVDELRGVSPKADGRLGVFRRQSGYFLARVRLLIGLDLGYVLGF